MARKKAAPKPKNPKYERIERDQDAKIYGLLESLIERFHKSSLGEAKILLAYEYDVKPDKDDTLRLWKVKVAGKLDRLLFPFDIVLVINFAAWQALAAHHDAILDEALCAINIDLNKHGEKKTDEKGRIIFRVRKPPVQAFPENHRRFGLWQEALLDYVRSMVPKLPPVERGLFDEPEAAYRGFARMKAPKADKALLVEVAKRKVDEMLAFRDKGNVGAAHATERVLDDAGWCAVEMATAVAS